MIELQTTNTEGYCNNLDILNHKVCFYCYLNMVQSLNYSKRLVEVLLS